MTQATAKLVDDFRQLSATERAEFLGEVVSPATADADLTEDDFSTIAAQTFARLDAEEEQDAKS